MDPAFPRPIRFLLARDAKLLCGAVTAVQRFAGARPHGPEKRKAA